MECWFNGLFPKSLYLPSRHNLDDQVCPPGNYCQKEKEQYQVNDIRTTFSLRRIPPLWQVTEETQLSQIYRIDLQ
jgi:hypothetical protein